MNIRDRTGEEMAGVRLVARLKGMSSPNGSAYYPWKAACLECGGELVVRIESVCKCLVRNPRYHACRTCRDRRARARNDAIIHSLASGESRDSIAFRFSATGPMVSAVAVKEYEDGLLGQMIPMATREELVAAIEHLPRRIRVRVALALLGRTRHAA